MTKKKDAMDELYELLSKIRINEDNIEIVKGDIEYLLKELNKMSKEKNINFIIFTNLKREYESYKIKDISSFENNKILEKYIDNISILDKEEIYSIKEKEYINE